MVARDLLDKAVKLPDMQRTDALIAIVVALISALGNAGASDERIRQAVLVALEYGPGSHVQPDPVSRLSDAFTVAGLNT